MQPLQSKFILISKRSDYRLSITYGLKGKLMGVFDLNIQAEPTAQIAPANGFCPHDTQMLGLSGPVKRLMDMVLTLPALIFLAPIFLTIAIAIKLEGGPLLFRQIRIGRNGKRFAMLKFRTMHVDAETRLTQLIANCPDSRAEWQAFQKLRHDPRITRIGHFLRRSSLDELPQLLNILIGDMSLVGQRPILPGQRDTYGRHINGYNRARPGLTGLWQISGRSSLTFIQRASLGSDYINRWSLWLDIKIIALTIPSVLFSQDAC